MIPYIDRVGAAWAADLFEATIATERVLVLRDATQLLACGAEGKRIGSIATRIIDYGGADNTNETFHAKIVLADGVAAYVGSANLLRRSKSTNLECGMLVEGPAVAAVKVLLDAVISMANS
jgi:phosphatidylserine/phosphatidylglycerophosphate/cardiolipin synthase-like enzyme